MRKADEYVEIYENILKSKTDSDNELEVKNKALAKIMTMFTDELVGEIVKLKIMEGAKMLSIIENQFNKYKAFAYKVHINPMGFYEALKQVNPTLVEGYEKLKTAKKEAENGKQS